MQYLQTLNVRNPMNFFCFPMILMASKNSITNAVIKLYSSGGGLTAVQPPSTMMLCPVI